MPSPGREVWGPRVWRLLHRLSFYSDRRDVVAAWRGVLKTISETMPCALCRGHMKEYLTANPLAITLDSRGPAVKEYMVMWLYRFHNHVRLSGGGIEFPFEELVSLYGGGGHGLCVEESVRLLGELTGYWSDLPTREFRTAVTYLISLIRGGTLV